MRTTYLESGQFNSDPSEARRRFAHLVASMGGMTNCLSGPHLVREAPVGKTVFEVVDHAAFAG